MTEKNTTRTPFDGVNDDSAPDLENKSAEAQAAEVKTALPTLAGTETYEGSDSDGDGDPDPDKVKVELLQHVTIDGDNWVPGSQPLVDRHRADTLVAAQQALRV